MKVALVHDYIKEYGGAERVLEALHEIWPNAPVYTSVYLPEFLGPHKARFRNWDIRTSFLQHLPFKEKLISPFRLVTPLVFKKFDFSKFDVVIVSATGAYSPNIIETRDKRQETRRPIHFCYCHTPPRYLYGFATARDWKKNIVFRVIGEIGNHFLRLVDFKSAQNVDFFIANSKNVAGRIKKFYRKDSAVIYPPVDFARSQRHVSDDVRLYNFKSQSSNSVSLSKSRLQTDRQPTFSSSESGLSPRFYFLAGGRIAKPKHIDLIVETFTKLKLPLKVFGRTFAGHDSQFMIHNSDIDFVGEVTDEEKLELMKNAKSFVFAAEDEDFGITPIEAASVGTPVIAFASGGVLESVIDGKTGILYRLNDIYHLSKAVKDFEKTKFDTDEILKHAQKFSKERFKKEIREFVEDRIEREREEKRKAS